MATYVTKTEFNNTIKQVNNAFTNVAGKTLYNNESVDINIDNLAKITNCENFSFTDLMNILNYKNPSVRLSSSVSTYTYEIGDTITGGVTLNAEVSLGTSPITKLEFYKDNTVVSTIVDGLDTGNIFNYAYGITISTDTVFKAAITTEDGSTFSDSISFNFYYPVYHGVTDKTVEYIIPSDISSLTKDIRPKGNMEYTYSVTNERCVLAYPKSYGQLSIIYDKNKFDNSKSFDIKTVTVHGIEYLVYVTKTLGNVKDFNYIFNF